MQIANIKVSRRKSPPGACIEFVGQDGQTIEVELRGEEFAEMSDDDIVARAKSTMSGVSDTTDNDQRPDAGLDQTLDQP